MKIYYLLAIGGVFLGTIFAPICWPLLVVMVAARRRTDLTGVYTLAFSVGLVNDLVGGWILGYSVVLYLFGAVGMRAFLSRFGENWKVAAVLLVVGQIVFRFWYVFR